MSKIPIVYEDEFMLVLNKPAGLVVEPSETQKVETLADILISDFGIQLDRGGIVHRLDKDTSGLLLAAKTQVSLENLQAQFKSREVKKEYLALVHGRVEKPGVVIGAIERNPKMREKFVVMEGGREAETSYEPIDRYTLSEAKMGELFPGLNKNQKRKLERKLYGEFTLLRCFPRTGRTHQIRVHLKHIGFPIVGDEKYAGRKTARWDSRWVPRQFLHAAKISFHHPMSGKVLVFESPLPDDLQQVLGSLEKVE